MKLAKLTALLVALSSVAAAITLRGQQRPPNREWTAYGADNANTHYSPLEQITKDNFSKLEVAWRFKADALGPRPEYNWESTPLEANGMVYVTAGTRRDVVALDAETGEMLWMYSINEGKRGDSAPRKLSGRGLAYYTDGRGDNRVIYVTPGYQLVALDAKTGRPIADFGVKGIVDLKQNDDQAMDPITGEIGLHATPIVAKNTIIVGAASGVAYQNRQNERLQSGFDVKTGSGCGSLRSRSSANRERHVGKESGLHRQRRRGGRSRSRRAQHDLPASNCRRATTRRAQAGANLLASRSSPISRRASEWHYQLAPRHLGLRHPVPILIDITANGRAIKALAQPTKQSFLYVFDRVPASRRGRLKNVGGRGRRRRVASPTQLLSTKPPAHDAGHVGSGPHRSSLRSRPKR
jgi:quinoprotein glucose dehydrogenase